MKTISIQIPNLSFEPEVSNYIILFDPTIEQLNKTVELFPKIIVFIFSIKNPDKINEIIDYSPFTQIYMRRSEPIYLGNVKNPEEIALQIVNSLMEILVKDTIPFKKFVSLDI